MAPSSPEPASDGPTSVTRGEVARGAALAGLSRAGALIEALSQPLFIGLFGLATYGVYVVLWGAVNLLSNILDLSMTSALQRVVPMQEREESAHGAVKLALLVALGASLAAALLITFNADRLAGYVSAAPDDRAHLPVAIALFAWALPLWTFVEVATSAARARRAFGPEIRIRIFWEQIARILFAVGAFLIGLKSIGLMVAHLCSLSLMAVLCVRLLGRYYDLRLILRAPIAAAPGRDLILSGVGLLPAALSRRLLIDAPPVLLNLFLPGAAGAAAAGLFEIGRKLSTVPYIIRQSFQYVLAPLSSAQARVDRLAIGPLYHFASRVSTALVVPLAGLMIFAAHDVLSVYRKEAEAALPILVVLSAARAAEAIVGPATSIVEMIGHRILPTVNSILAITLWVGLASVLTPTLGAFGMAVAVSIATVASTYAATVELRISDGVSPFGFRLLLGLTLALLGLAAMWVVVSLFDGPVRFGALLLVWAGTTWLTLRYGLTRPDQEALGPLSRSLRIIR